MHGNAVPVVIMGNNAWELFFSIAFFAFTLFLKEAALHFMSASVC